MGTLLLQLSQEILLRNYISTYPHLDFQRNVAPQLLIRTSAINAKCLLKKIAEVLLQTSKLYFRNTQLDPNSDPLESKIVCSGGAGSGSVYIIIFGPKRGSTDENNFRSQWVRGSESGSDWLYVSEKVQLSIRNFFSSAHPQPIRQYCGNGD